MISLTGAVSKIIQIQQPHHVSLPTKPPNPRTISRSNPNLLQLRRQKRNLTEENVRQPFRRRHLRLHLPDLHDNNHHDMVLLLRGNPESAQEGNYQSPPRHKYIRPLRTGVQVAWHRSRRGRLPETGQGRVVELRRGREEEETSNPYAPTDHPRSLRFAK